MSGPQQSASTPSPPAWDVIITEWALDSYLNLKHAQVFTDAEYWSVLRPDVELLKEGIPSPNPKFAATSFWGPAKLGSVVLGNGYKMKWRQIGPGLVQLRLPVTAGSRGGVPSAFLCGCYEKRNVNYEQRKMARFKTHMNLIAQDRYTYRGAL
jgi:hypothetical protein